LLLYHLVILEELGVEVAKVGTKDSIKFLQILVKVFFKDFGYVSFFL
jgi:hypothetical protein